MAGGLGTRLRPLTDNIPKSLIPVAGRPVILYLLDSFSRVSSDFILTASYRYEKIIEYFSGKPPIKGTFLFSVEREPLGTAGGLKKTEKYLDDTFLVGNADTVFKEDMRKILQIHKRDRNMITIGLTKVDNPSEFGVVRLKDRRIIEFQEKPKSNPVSHLANAGIYVMEQEVLDYIPRRGPSDIAKELIPALQKEGKRIGGFEIGGIWIDIGRPLDLIRANIIMSQNLPRKRRQPNIKGSSYIGKNVTIGKNCRIENTAIYDDVVIEDDVILTNSVLYSGSFIGRMSKVTDSILSFNSVLGEGVSVNDSVIGGGVLLRKGGKIEGTVVSSNEDNP